MSTATGLIHVRRALWWACIFLSLLVGFSRIFIGHHYPLDVLSSYMIVIVINTLFHRFFESKLVSLYLWADGKSFCRRSRTAPLS